MIILDSTAFFNNLILSFSLFSSVVSDNPVTVQNTPDTCMCPTTNRQMEYDDMCVCKRLLTKDLGKVRKRRERRNKWRKG